MRRQAIALALLLGLLLPTLATAQTVRVLGVGRLSFDITTLTIAEANAQTYKAFMPSTVTTGVLLTVTCGTPAANAAPGTQATCVFPLSALPLSATPQSLAISSSVAAGDGTVENLRVTVPFVLSLAARPVSPLAAMRVLPASP